MSIRIEKRNIVFESVSGVTIEPEYVFTNEDEVKENLKKNPFPGTEHYTEEDLMIESMGGAHGFYKDPVENELSSHGEEEDDDFHRTGGGGERQ